MSDITFHPAPGFGDLLPGWFVVPQNPIRQGGVGVGVGYVPGIGELLPGRYSLPENPILRAMSGETMPGGGHPNSKLSCISGCGCGSQSRVALEGLGVMYHVPYGEFGGRRVMPMVDPAPYSPARYSLSGLGDVSSVMDTISSTVSSMTTTEWLMIGGGVVVLFMLMGRPGKSEYRQALSSAKDQYRKAVSKARTEYPRIGGRIKRGLGAATD